MPALLFQLAIYEKFSRHFNLANLFSKCLLLPVIDLQGRVDFIVLLRQIPECKQIFDTNTGMKSRHFGRNRENHYKFSKFLQNRKINYVSRNMATPNSRIKVSRKFHIIRGY